MQGAKAELADRLFEVGAIKLAGVGEAPAEGFRLKLHEKNPDAPLSPIYLNLRTPDNKGGTLTPEVLELIAVVMMERLPLHFTYVIGIPNAGTPIAEELFRHLKHDPVYPHVQLLHLGKVEQEAGRRIVGIQEDLQDVDDPCVLLVDDLITQADTKLEAITAVEDDGLEVARLMVLVDREQGGKEQIAAAGHRLTPVFTLGELLDYYVTTDRIGLQIAHDVGIYLRANRV
jgi:uridine monophosphate synthetase